MAVIADEVRGTAIDGAEKKNRTWSEAFGNRHSIQAAEERLPLFIEASTSGADLSGFCFRASHQGQGFGSEPFLAHFKLGDFQLDKARNPFFQARNPVGLLKEIIRYFQRTHGRNLQEANFQNQGRMP